MIRLLFRRVVISKTYLDRYRFLSISRSPRLAYAARELVWYELAEDETVFFELEDQENGESQSELPAFSKIARESFWLPSASARAAEDDQPDMQTWRHRVALVKFRFGILFGSALDSMPNLTSFVSCPMPPHYIINKRVYPLTAQLFQKATGASTLHSNDGFFDFLLPAMRRPGSEIQRLTFINEQPQTRNFAVRLYDVLSFSALTRVEICLESGHELTLHQIHACLRASKGFTHLKICAEKVHNKLEPAMLNALFGTKGYYGDKTPLWPHLRKLELTDFSLLRKGNTKALVSLLRAQAATLTHIALNYCQFSGTLIAYMTGIPMNLESLRILCPFRPNIARPSELLAYVNGTGPVPSRVDERCDDWNTDTFVHDPQHTPALAIAHGETWHHGNVDIDEILEQLHPADRALLRRPEQSLYASEKLLKFSRSGPVRGTNTTAGSSDAGLTEGPNKYKLSFLFIHPDGREAKGEEPLGFFSDWEDSCDERSSDESGSDESGSDESGSDESGSDESGSDEISSDESSSDEEDSGENDYGRNSSNGSDGSDPWLPERAHPTTPKESRKRYLAIPRWKKLKNNARGASPDMSDSSE